jgi:hypothetical protein
VRAVDRGAEVVFVDNRPVPIDGADLDGRIEEILDLTVGRASDRTAKGPGR